MNLKSQNLLIKMTGGSNRLNCVVIEVDRVILMVSQNLCPFDFGFVDDVFLNCLSGGLLVTPFVLK